MKFPVHPGILDNLVWNNQTLKVLYHTLFCNAYLVISHDFDRRHKKSIGDGKERVINTKVTANVTVFRTYSIAPSVSRCLPHQHVIWVLVIELRIVYPVTVKSAGPARSRPGGSR